MVSAWGCEQRMVLAQIAIDAKSNEIAAVPRLLEMLSLKGTIVTVDALNCQRDIPSSGYPNGFAVGTLASLAQKIVDQSGDRVPALKGNQGTLHDDFTRYFDDPASKTTTANPPSRALGRPTSRPITAASRPARPRSALTSNGCKTIINGPV
jgi:predicted transposase YbfD/YdcC